jgi:hypothetical protein
MDTPIEPVETRNKFDDWDDSQLVKGPIHNASDAIIEASGKIGKTADAATAVLTEVLATLLRIEKLFSQSKSVTISRD